MFLKKMKFANFLYLNLRTTIFLKHQEKQDEEENRNISSC